MTGQPASPNVVRLARAVDTVVVRVTRHWMAWLLLLLFIFQGLPFAAPALARAGVPLLPELLYTVYGMTCHQLAYRSFFLFGAQPAYSVTELQARLGVGNPAADLFFWRGVVGDAALGYKLAYCERDTAMYTSMFFAALGYALVRRYRAVQPLDWKWFVLIGLVPLGLDGTTQLVGVRESDPALRTVTGILFGVSAVWFLMPYLEAAMVDLHAQTARQLERIRQRDQKVSV